MKKPPYRDGRVHVCENRCSTCVFRQGNPMHLMSGRLKEMIADSLKHESAIICHQTLSYYPGSDGEAVCKGFFDRYPTQPLQVAERLGLIEYQPVHDDRRSP